MSLIWRDGNKTTYEYEVWWCFSSELKKSAWSSQSNENISKNEVKCVFILLPKQSSIESRCMKLPISSLSQANYPAGKAMGTLLRFFFCLLSSHLQWHKTARKGRGQLCSSAVSGSFKCLLSVKEIKERGHFTRHCSSIHTPWERRSWLCTKSNFSSWFLDSKCLALLNLVRI